MNFQADAPRLSISFGIKTMNETAYTAKELIRLADENMYKAKNRKANPI